nr:hypothetical protein [Oenococcus oeni]
MRINSEHRIVYTVEKKRVVKI